MNKIKKMALSLPVSLIVASPLIVLAQAPDSPITSLSGVQTILENIANWLSIFFFALTVIFIILAAFQYLTAGGDDEKIKKAKKQLMYAVVAIVVALLATGFKTIIFGLLSGGTP